MTNPDGAGHPPTSDDPLSGTAAPGEQQGAAGYGQPPTAGYEQQAPGYGQPPTAGYEQQAPAGYQQEPADGYEQPSVGGYGQQAAGYEQPPVGGSEQQAGGYEQAAGYTEQPPVQYQPPPTYGAPGAAGGYGATSQPGQADQAGAMYGATSQPGQADQAGAMYGTTSQPNDPNQAAYGATSQPGQPSQPSPTAPYEQQPAAGYQPPQPHEPSTQPYATGYHQGSQPTDVYGATSQPGRPAHQEHPTAVYGATSQPGQPDQPAAVYGATSQPEQPDQGYQSAAGYGHQSATGYQPPPQPQAVPPQPQQPDAGAAPMATTPAATVPMATAAPAAAPAGTAPPAPHYPGQAPAPYPGQQAYVPGQYDGAYDAGPPALEHRRRPFTIWLVSLLMWLGALGAMALGVMVLVLGLTARQALFAELAAIPGFQEIEAVFTTAIIGIGAVAIVGGLIYFLLSISAFRGSNPVRWVLVVFMILSTLGWVPVLAIVIGNIDDASIILMSFVPFVALLLFVVLYLLPPAGAWYRYRGELKRQARAAGH